MFYPPYGAALFAAFCLCGCAGLVVTPIPRPHELKAKATEQGDSKDGPAAVAADAKGKDKEKTVVYFDPPLPPNVNPNPDASAWGFRYYDKSPYLLVKSDNNGGLEGEIIYLPDPNRKRSIRPYAFLAKNDLTLDFEDGALTSATSDQDSTEFPLAVVSALTSMVGSGFSKEAGPKGTVPAPRLFKVIVKGSTISLVGSDANPANINY